MKYLTPLEEFPGYSISQYGLIYDTTNELVDIFKDPSNHWLRAVRLNGVVVDYAYVIASAFVPNPSGFKFVGFIKEEIYMPSNLVWISDPYIPRAYRNSLSWADIFDIRKSSLSRKELAAKYNVSVKYIGLILNRKAWIRF